MCCRCVLQRHAIASVVLECRTIQIQAVHRHSNGTDIAVSLLYLICENQLIRSRILMVLDVIRLQQLKGLKSSIQIF